MGLSYVEVKVQDGRTFMLRQDGGERPVVRLRADAPGVRKLAASVGHPAPPHKHEPVREPPTEPVPPELPPVEPPPGEPAPPQTAIARAA